eukprot:TRINITY_DN5779_c0_g1_i1.p1 TRINITY_DN5779_c0_g1~~TRINITY_DN5779_c0_g1_i1.p1  ORF type:complete len:814 (-),score=243.80 TRINITY_DN5779_c0_g1_i1:49-2490(-)
MRLSLLDVRSLERTCRRFSRLCHSDRIWDHIIYRYPDVLHATSVLSWTAQQKLHRCGVAALINPRAQTLCYHKLGYQSASSVLDHSPINCGVCFEPSMEQQAHVDAILDSISFEQGVPVPYDLLGLTTEPIVDANHQYSFLLQGRKFVIRTISSGRTTGMNLIEEPNVDAFAVGDQKVLVVQENLSRIFSVSSIKMDDESVVEVASLKLIIHQPMCAISKDMALIMGRDRFTVWFHQDQRQMHFNYARGDDVVNIQIDSLQTFAIMLCRNCIKIINLFTGSVVSASRFDFNDPIRIGDAPQSELLRFLITPTRLFVQKRIGDVPYIIILHLQGQHMDIARDYIPRLLDGSLSPLTIGSDIWIAVLDLAHVSVEWAWDHMEQIQDRYDRFLDLLEICPNGTTREMGNRFRDESNRTMKSIALYRDFLAINFENASMEEIQHWTDHFDQISKMPTHLPGIVAQTLRFEDRKKIRAIDFMAEMEHAMNAMIDPNPQSRSSTQLASASASASSSASASASESPIDETNVDRAKDLVNAKIFGQDPTKFRGDFTSQVEKSFVETREKLKKLIFDFIERQVMEKLEKIQLEISEFQVEKCHVTDIMKLFREKEEILSEIWKCQRDLQISETSNRMSQHLDDAIEMQLHSLSEACMDRWMGRFEDQIRDATSADQFLFIRRDVVLNMEKLASESEMKKNWTRLNDLCDRLDGIIVIYKDDLMNNIDKKLDDRSCRSSAPFTEMIDDTYKQIENLRNELLGYPEEWDSAWVKTSLDRLDEIERQLGKELSNTEIMQSLDDEMAFSDREPSDDECAEDDDTM